MAVYAFARGQGLAPADAEDLTQNLLSDLLDRQAFEKVSAAKGKLRLPFNCGPQRGFRTAQVASALTQYPKEPPEIGAVRCFRQRRLDIPVRVDVAIEVAGLAGEAAVGARGRVFRRHQGGEQQGCAQPSLRFEGIAGTGSHGDPRLPAVVFRDDQRVEER